ncbi:hypothetical protein ACFOJE_19445 [Azotobacter bryophylli]|uniref:Uncharacterized protein n=1 Tax=Azotobacter bryophylli TaxID=1986537 RepID=A0ABV7AY23_9GAMM
MPATEPHVPLKVLSPEFASNLRAFNGAARTLQRMGIRLLQFDLTGNRLVIADPADGRRLIEQRLTEGFQRTDSAGSTLYRVQFQGVTLEWREPISYARPAEWAAPTVH